MNNIYKEISNKFLLKSYICYTINPNRECIFNLKINNDIGSIYIYIKNILEYRNTGIRFPRHDPELLIGMENAIYRSYLQLELNNR